MATAAPTRTIRIAMNGVTGRMGYRQHLVRSILQIRDQGGIRLADGSLVGVEPVLVGRNESRLRELADRHDVGEWQHRSGGRARRTSPWTSTSTPR